ncbi:DUF2914 domain-containing protein [Rhodohalobacter mucosus]|uniref:DUF2914 domain-containing protein n=1 Tax=Rhodohalobacter mucosus TaxID=2079485 RepID=A0A316TSG6_9BACT|nr:DUF2914 domain-containing protein [Rhodohalobacter mucosus]PWN06279.1 DUF2914 domain-containing protein [Rhodohalobacter mucosus]
MMKSILGTAILLLAFQSVASGQTIAVEEFEFGTAVENRQIVNADSAFSADVGQVFCFTRITGAESETSVTHIWYLDGVEMATVELPVRGTDWRTWSSKTIFSDWTGEWSVDVLDAEGNMLMSKSFTVGM